MSLASKLLVPNSTIMGPLPVLSSWPSISIPNACSAAFTLP